MNAFELIPFNHKYTKKSLYLWLIYDIIFVILLVLLVLLLMPYAIPATVAIILIIPFIIYTGYLYFSPTALKKYKERLKSKLRYEIKIPI